MLAKGAQLATSGVILEPASVPMADGCRLATNVFRPGEGGRHPVIVSVTPYGKDNLPDRTMAFMRLARVHFGTLRCSPWTGFESPDPLFWVPRGYVVVQADARGMHKSEGQGGVLRDQDAEDYATLIGWAAAEPWSTGKVGLLGVSYLAMSQWRVAALRPPSLCAICPWEGVTDMFREFAFQDGVPETGFLQTWWEHRIVQGQNAQTPLAEDFLEETAAHPLDDAFWASRRPALERIDVPALVCASWSDHGLHTRGSIIGFERLGSKQKWLFTHGRKKWETFYSAEALDVQARFFDRFLRDVESGIDREPAVRLERRRAYYQADVRAESAWPLPGVAATPLYLTLSSRTLGRDPCRAETSTTYQSRGHWLDYRASFFYTFPADVELTGGMRLKLWVSADEADDLDLFVTLHKVDRNGREVFFSGYNGYPKDCVAKGWLRASHRALDPAKTSVLRPWHTHRAEERIPPGTAVPVEIEVLASSTFFEKGTSLRLDIQGGDAAWYPAFAHRHTRNRGLHRIHCGGPYDSQLVVPLVTSSGHAKP